jgi:MSHA biogenesis protein MshQ
VRLLLLLASACGRVAFDGVPDAQDDPFAAGCVVGLAMDEPAWSGAAAEVRNACDSGHHGTAVQSAQRVDDDVRDRVGEMPGPSGCVQLPDTPALHATTGLTLSAWIYPRSLDGVTPYGVIAKRTDFTIDDAEYTMFVWTDNTVWVDLDTRNDRARGAKQLVNGRWQQVSMVYDGTQPTPQRVRIYVDGALDAVLPETSASLKPYPSPLSVGCLPELPASGPQIALEGLIDDVRIWTRALASQEITDWYLATKR